MKPIVKIMAAMAVLLGMFMPMQATAAIEADAVEGITLLFDPTTDGESSVAYHPTHNRYYAAEIGNTSAEAYAWDASGNLVNTGLPGVDNRALNYNPNNGLLESVSYNACCNAPDPVRGIQSLNLDGSGDYLGTNTQLLATPIPGLGASSQTMPSYDPVTDQLFAYQNDGTVSVANRTTGAAQPTITLDLGGAGVVSGNLHHNFVGFTGRTGEELAILDHTNTQILVFDLTGAFIGASVLPAGVTISNTSYSSGYANGLFFLRDDTIGANGGYRSFRIFTPMVPGPDDDPVCGNLIPVGGPHAAWALAILPLMIAGIVLVRRRA